MGYDSIPELPHTPGRSASLSESASNSTSTGVIAAIGAYLIWGFSPLFYRAVGAAPALEILAHRVVWSLLLCLLLVAVRGRMVALKSAFLDPRDLLTLLVSAVLVSANWLGFIWAVNNERALEASMGYFIFPIVTIVLGWVFLGERLNRRQLLALALVVGGVLILLIDQWRLPWIALLLAVSFSLSGLVRKKVAVGPLVGLTVECMLLLPAALCYLLYLQTQGALVFGSQSVGLDILLMCSALVTALPLILFTSATRRLRLGTVGMLMYLNPSCQFLLAVFLFGEPFTRAHLHTFLCIWAGLLLFTLDARRRQRMPQTS